MLKVKHKFSITFFKFTTETSYRNDIFIPPVYFFSNYVIDLPTYTYNFPIPLYTILYILHV